MSYITVKTQAELDSIPRNTKDIIIIAFGTIFHPALIRKKYKHPVKIETGSCAIALGCSIVEACDNSAVIAYDNSVIEANENS